MNHWMRPLSRGMALLTLALVGFVSCSDDDNDESNHVWSGVLSASVDGVPTQFSDPVWLEEINGGDAWVIGNAGQTQLQFYIASAQPGTYSTDSNGMGRYVPDTSVPGYDYSAPAGELRSMPGMIGGSITVETATAERLSGHFAFQVATPALDDTVTISDGVFDLRFGPPAATESPVGIWQRTQSGIEQETIELLASGTAHWIHASYELQLCQSASGSWSQVGDSLRMNLEGEISTVAWSRMGTALAIWDTENPTPVLYGSVASLPSCADYGFGGSDTGWTGTLTAIIDGTPVDFGQELWLETIMGDDAWVIGNAGDRQIQFYVASAEPGTYPANPSSNEGMGRYVPDTSVPGYDYNNPVGEYNTNFPGAGGVISVSAASPTSLSGTFSFAVKNEAGDTITITNGVVDIQTSTAASPAGIWQTGMDGDFVETLELAENGSFASVLADWESSECVFQTSVWNSTATHIIVGTGLNSYPLGSWSLEGGLLIIDRGAGDIRTYLPVVALPDCEDYVFDPLEAVYGTWQRGMAGNFEETMAIEPDQDFMVTVALFADEICFVVNGSWEMDGDTLRVDYIDGNGPPAYRVTTSGINLILSAPGHPSMVFTRVAEMPDCADYGFETGPPVGIWQQSVPDLFEYSLEFAGSGDFGRTYAHFVDEWCYESSGSWTASADSLFIQYDNGQETLAYERVGNGLEITFDDGNSSFLTLTDTMPLCADYGLGGSPPAGKNTPRALQGAEPGTAPTIRSPYRAH
jgi:hypothetical protein